MANPQAGLQSPAGNPTSLVPPASSVRDRPAHAEPGRLDEVRFAQGVLKTEAEALSGLGATLDETFCRAVDLVVACADSGGTVLVTGLGKSGLVGAKISATMASLGIPSHAVHPSEAAHGDLGRFRTTDTVICISFSGETDEVVNLAAVLKQDFEFARAFVDPKSVSDAKIAGLCILFEEGGYKLRKISASWSLWRASSWLVFWPASQWADRCRSKFARSGRWVEVMVPVCRVRRRRDNTRRRAAPVLGNVGHPQ
mgnify:CR=1 FL=1